jgi:CDGSH-type Zn-finger protein
LRFDLKLNAETLGAANPNGLSSIRQVTSPGAAMSDPERPQLSPYQVALEAGKRYAWCRCGRSQKQPFCDGAHAGTGIEPLLFTAERSELALLCGCKDTGDPPYCDGSHMLL